MFTNNSAYTVKALPISIDHPLTTNKCFVIVYMALLLLNCGSKLYTIPHFFTFHKTFKDKTFNIKQKALKIGALKTFRNDRY